MYSTKLLQKGKKEFLKYSCLTQKEGMLPKFLVWSCLLLPGIVLKRYDGDSLLRTLYKKTHFPVPTSWLSGL